MDSVGVGIECFDVSNSVKNLTDSEGRSPRSGARRFDLGRPETKIRKAIIYTRVSNDTSGRARSVSEQEEECRLLCEDNGWEIEEVIQDNDVGASRWSKGYRPGFERLHRILRPGHVLVMWESSRGTRKLSEFVEFRDLCAERQVLWCFKGRIYDPSHSGDRAITAYDAIRDEEEAERTRDRVLRAMRVRAKEGKPHGRLPYGYRRLINPRNGRTEGWEIDRDEAAIVREIVNRLLGGQSTYAICRDLNDRLVPSPRRSEKDPGRPWEPNKLRRMLMSPTYAALVYRHGEFIGEGEWDPILTEDEHRRVVAILTDPRRASVPERGPEPKHLLTGIATCGVCGSPVSWFGPRRQKTPGYKCKGRSCVTRNALKVDELVVDTMLGLLRDERVLKLLNETSPEEGPSEHLINAQTLQQRLESFYAEAADGKLSAAALSSIEARMLPQIEEARRLAASAAGNPRLLQLTGDDAREVWESLTLVEQREIVRSALVVRILPSRRGYVFDESSVDISWRE